MQREKGYEQERKLISKALNWSYLRISESTLQEEKKGTKGAKEVEFGGGHFMCVRVVREWAVVYADCPCCCWAE